MSKFFYLLIIATTFMGLSNIMFAQVYQKDLRPTVFGQQNGTVSDETQNAQPPPADETKTTQGRQERAAINLGVLMGGGGLIGTDLELLVTKQFGLQIGAGLGSVGGGINYHFKPYINSSFVSVQYWHQGFAENHYASYLGPMYVFRSKKIFQAGIGFGSVLSKGEKWYEVNTKNSDVPVILLYNIGLYIPL